MLLNDLIATDALSIPDYIYYIPVDLSTILYYAGINPDISREDFCGEFNITNLKHLEPFISEKNPKHNALWDAYVAAYCYSKIKLKEIIEGELTLLMM
jgi:hypothetical protein